MEWVWRWFENPLDSFLRFLTPTAPPPTPLPPPFLHPPLFKFDEQQASLRNASRAIDDERRKIMDETAMLRREREQLLAAQIKREEVALENATQLRREAEQLRKERDMERQQTIERLRAIETLNRAIASNPVYEEATGLASPAGSSHGAAPAPAATRSAPRPQPAEGLPSTGPKSLLVERPASASSARSEPRTVSRSSTGGSSDSGFPRERSDSLAMRLEENRARSDSGGSSDLLLKTLKPGHWDKLRRAYKDKVALATWLDDQDDKIKGIFANKSDVEMVVTLQRLMKLREMRDRANAGPARPERQSFSEKLKSFEQ